MLRQLDLRVSEVNTWSTNLYIDFATTVWLYHEYLLTLPCERQCIWRRQFSAVTAVFFATRYLTLVKQAIRLSQFMPWANVKGAAFPACGIILRVDAVLTAVLYASVSVFTAVRMFAISRRNLKLASLVLGLGVVHLCCNLYTNLVGRFQPIPSPLSGCVQVVIAQENISIVLEKNQPLTTSYRLAAYLGTGCIIVSELILQAYTWRKTLEIQRQLRCFNINKPLLSLLIRDGAVSYLLLTSWSILTRVVTRINLSAMALPGVSVLLCRFLLSLRQVSLPEQGISSARRVSRIVGNAGTPIRASLTQAVIHGSGSAGHDEDEEEDDVVSVTDDPLMAGLGPNNDDVEKSGIWGT